MSLNARRHQWTPERAAILIAAALMLSACSSTFDVLPEKAGGLPASAPQRPAEQMAFPNVYEVRPTREAKPLNDDEQKKLESELVTLREQQKQLANPPPPQPQSKKAATAPKKEPAPAKKTAAKEAPPAKKKQSDTVVPEQKGPVAAPKLIN